ncbi:MAG: SurA N-terminal domain-containing protein [Pseudomonadota bacterium]
MAKSAAGKGANIFVWILLGLLFVGLAGFGTGQFGGSIGSVASVGGRDISVNDYARALQQELRALQVQTGQAIPLSQAQAFGVTQSVLGRLMTSAAVDDEAEGLGVSVGDAVVRDQVLAQPGFSSLAGDFDRTVYEATLRQSGMTVREFEQRIRDETARGILQSAIIAGVAAPETAQSALVTFLEGRRNFTWLQLTAADLTEELPVPSELDLRNYHNDNPDRFTAPEARRITYAWLSPEMLIDQIEVDEARLREAYDGRQSEFDVPERRLVERLVFPDEAAAEAALARVSEGTSSFDDLVEERGLNLADVDLGDQTRDDLGDAGAGVFQMIEPGVVGPLPTSLGPALFRMNGILPAQFTSFEDALPELRRELAADRARREVSARIEEADDLLAGGATLEELADQTDFETGTVDFSAETSDSIAGYDGFRRAAVQANESDFPEILTLEDGGIFALRLDEIVPPALRPFDSVEDDVRLAWQDTQIEAELIQIAEAARNRVEEGEAFSTLGYTFRTETDITRRDFIQELPPSAISSVFEMAPEETTVQRGPGTVFVLRLDAVLPPDLDNPDTAQAAEQVETEIAQAIARDIFELYATALQSQASISIDQGALAAVHAQFP